MSVVKELKQNKAPGNDNRLNEYFVSYIDILSSHLVDLYLTLYLLLATFRLHGQKASLSRYSKKRILKMYVTIEV